MADHEAAPSVKSAAAERAWRSFKQGIGFDILVAIGLVLGAWAPEADLTSGEAWTYLGLSLAKTVLVTVAAYIMRLKSAPKAEIVG